MFSKLLVACLLVPHVLSYTWPSPQIDELEALYVQVNGFRNGNFGGFLTPCNEFFGTSILGRQTAAEWLRTAYHDMATHNSTDGTGGLDGSIAFETSRPENVGAGIISSLGFFATFISPRASMADLIALGTVFAVRSCGTGIDIPFRVGRKDATAAGPAGVPQPQEDLTSHIANFKKQGFNVTEMIGMVACGHTIGGVHGPDFPNIVPFDPNNIDPTNVDSTVRFDSSFAVYDNVIATEFHGNATHNPLVVGPTLTDSDNRIFNADSGVQMGKFASSNTVFLNTCINLMGRMIDTVPSTVTLTTPLTPIPVKPNNVGININNDGTMTFFGEIRLTAAPVTSNRQVIIHYKARDGLSCPECPAITATTNSTLTGTGFVVPTFSFYAFSATIPVARGISSFTVQIIDGSASTTATNGGAGFPVQDTVIFQQSRSCFTFGGGASLFAAVRTASGISSVSAQLTLGVAQPSPIQMPLQVVTQNPMTKGSAIGSSGYTLYSLTTTKDISSLATTGIIDIVGKKGTTTTTDLFHKIPDLAQC